MTTNNESKLGLKFMLLFIPVAFVTYLFHEFGQWNIQVDRISKHPVHLIKIANKKEK